MIVGEPLTPTQDMNKTPVMMKDRRDEPFSFESLRFEVKNGAGIAACVDWHNSASATGFADTANKWPHPLKRLVWSLTGRCNLSCRHCAVRDMYDDIIELDSSEIRIAVKDIIALGVPMVVLTGGEALLSPYLFEIARSLSESGITVTLITNGTLIDGDMAKRIKGTGISQVFVSIDDFASQKQDDTVRGAGNYQKAVDGVKRLVEVNLPVYVITTVNAINIRHLSDMRRAFTKLGASAWCLKPILPCGEAARNEELWLAEQDVNKIINFCYSALYTGGMPVIPSLTFEMHTEKGAEMLRFLYGEQTHTDVQGCDAGIFSMQIQPCGSLTGSCTMMPADAVCNLKDRSLIDAWQDKSSFKELREYDPSSTEGYCGKCDRRDTCKGGDINVRYAFGGINAENKYCAYRNFKLYGIEI